MCAAPPPSTKCSASQVCTSRSTGASPLAALRIGAPSVRPQGGPAPRHHAHNGPAHQAILITPSSPTPMTPSSSSSTRPPSEYQRPLRARLLTRLSRGSVSCSPHEVPTSRRSPATARQPPPWHGRRRGESGWVPLGDSTPQSHLVRGPRCSEAAGRHDYISRQRSPHEPRLCPRCVQRGRRIALLRSSSVDTVC